MSNFSFFQNAVDGTFSQAALVGKIQIKEQLPKYLGGEIQLGEGYSHSNSALVT